MTGLKWYLHEPFMLGADVPDGREGRSFVNEAWSSAVWCHSWPNTILETRPVPERMVAIDLPESVVRAVAHMSADGPLRDACRSAVEQLDGGS